MADTLPPVVATTAGAVRVLTLNRPDRLNAVSLPLYEELLAAVRAAADDDAVRALVLTGAGRAFCAGADLKAHAVSEMDPATRRRYVRAGQRANLALRRSPKPVVAAVHGAAVGAGFELALSCDFLVVASDAKLRLPEVVLGTFVGGGITWDLPRRAGLVRARALLLLGEFFSGEEAVSYGLAYRVVEPAAVLRDATALAERLAVLPPVPLRLMRRVLRRALSGSLEDALRAEARALDVCMATAEFRAAARAFADPAVRPSPTS